MKLYEITEEMKGLQSLVDTEELTAEMIADTMEGLQIAFEEKAKGALMVRQNLLSEVAGIEKEIERLTALKVAPENNANRLTDYIKENMIAADTSKMDLGIFRLTLKKASKQLGEIDESKVSDDYWIHIPKSKELDKRLLLRDAKESNIDGVELIDGARALIIK